MSLNMVANRADKGIFNFTLFGKMMAKLRMSKDKSSAENIPEWEEALRNTFATAGFGHFLGRQSSLMTPPDQVARLLVERELETALSTIGKVDVNTKVKMEPPPGLAEAEVKGSPSSEKNVGGSSNISEHERVVRLEALYRENARRQIEELLVEHAQSESRGVRKEVIFLESMSSMQVEYAYLNPKATVLVDIAGEPRLLEPEADLKRLQRQAAWQLITQSITDMPDANWKSVELGNVSHRGQYPTSRLGCNHAWIFRTRPPSWKLGFFWRSREGPVRTRPPSQNPTAQSDFGVGRRSGSGPDRRPDLQPDLPVKTRPPSQISGSLSNGSGPDR